MKRETMFYSLLLIVSEAVLRRVVYNSVL